MFAVGNWTVLMDHIESQCANQQVLNYIIGCGIVSRLFLSTNIYFKILPYIIQILSFYQFSRVWSGCIDWHQERHPGSLLFWRTYVFWTTRWKWRVCLWSTPWGPKVLVCYPSLFSLNLSLDIILHALPC